MKKLIILPFLLVCIPVLGTEYFVKNGGSDSNTGLSDAQAWAHHPWMSTWTGDVVLLPGDIVYLKRDNTWSISNPTSAFISVKQNGKEGSYIKTTAYGTGAKPKVEILTNTQQNVIWGIGKSFIIFDNIEIKHWSPKQNLGNYYGIRLGNDGGEVSHNWVITNCDIHNMPSIGIYVAYDAFNVIIGDTTVTSTATSTSYSNHIYDCGYAGIGLSGCNPLTLNSNYYVYYNYIHDINTDGTDNQNAYGVFFSSLKNSYGPTKFCYTKYNYIRNIPTWEGLDVHNGEYIYYQDNYIHNCKSDWAVNSGQRSLLDSCST